MALTQPPPPQAGPRAQSHPSSRGPEEIERMADELRTLGVSNSQLREMGQRRELVRDIRVESPVDGVVLKRGVSPGLRFDRGFELYRIADLSRVWILADVYRDDLPFIRRGAVRADHHRRGEPRAAGDGEPVGADLRRGDADAEGAARGGEPAAGPSSPACSSTWSSRSTSRRRSSCRRMRSWTRGCARRCSSTAATGHFEPRLVETGWRVGDDVEVTKGLEPGERIVISGTFFVDSESRMKAAAPAVAKP